MDNNHYKLEKIFDRQQELMTKFRQVEAENGLLPDKEVPVNINSHKGQAVLKAHAWQITEELGEAMNELKNRPWKTKTRETDYENYKEELIDAFHFFIELFILSGMTPEDVFNGYMGKAEVNKQRQESGV